MGKEKEEKRINPNPPNYALDEKADLVSDVLELVEQYQEDVIALALAKQARKGGSIEYDQETLLLLALGSEACIAAKGIEDLCLGVANPEEQIAAIVTGLGLIKQEDQVNYGFPNSQTEKALHIALGNVLARGRIKDSPLPPEPGEQVLVLQYTSILPTPSSYVMLLNQPIVNVIPPSLSFVPAQAVSGRERVL